MNEVAQSVPDQELPTPYGCGPIRCSGRIDALYERRLLFDDVVTPEAAGTRERFEAAARSVRDVLSQRWILTDGTYDRENPKLADLKSYLEADQRLTALYADGDAWAYKAILNVAGCGKFSSNHTIAEHAAEIWRVKPCPVP